MCRFASPGIVLEAKLCASLVCRIVSIMAVWPLLLCRSPEEFALYSAWAANDFGAILRCICKTRLEPYELEQRRRKLAIEAVKQLRALRNASWQFQCPNVMLLACRPEHQSPVTVPAFCIFVLHSKRSDAK